MAQGASGLHRRHAPLEAGAAVHHHHSELAARIAGRLQSGQHHLAPPGPDPASPVSVTVACAALDSGDGAGCLSAALYSLQYPLRCPLRCPLCFQLRCSLGAASAAVSAALSSALSAVFRKPV